MQRNNPKYKGMSLPQPDITHKFVKMRKESNFIFFTGSNLLLITPHCQFPLI